MKTVKLFLAVAFFIASASGYAQTEQSIVVMDNINTWEEAIKPFLGKKVYVDIWATWCAPCIDEFKHNEELKKILVENDIQQLYISLDGNVSKEIWESHIKSYNLTGKHIIANSSVSEKFVLELVGVIFSNKGVPFEKQEDMMDTNIEISIPRYVLIDEEGNIMDRYAKRPSRIVAEEKLW